MKALIHALGAVALVYSCNMSSLVWAQIPPPPDGAEALSVRRGNNQGYQDIPLPEHAAKALSPGANTLAIHVDNRKSLNTRQPDVEKRAGSQFIDAGIGEESIEW